MVYVENPYTPSLHTDSQTEGGVLRTGIVFLFYSIYVIYRVVYTYSTHVHV